MPEVVARRNMKEPRRKIIYKNPHSEYRRIDGLKHEERGGEADLDELVKIACNGGVEGGGPSLREMAEKGSEGRGREVMGGMELV